MTDDIALGRALISELIVNHGVAGAAQLLRAAADALEEDAGFRTAEQAAAAGMAAVLSPSSLVR